MRGILRLYCVADLGGAWDIEYLSTDKIEVLWVRQEGQRYLLDEFTWHEI